MFRRENKRYVIIDAIKDGESIPFDSIRTKTWNTTKKDREDMKIQQEYEKRVSKKVNTNNENSNKKENEE